MLAISLETDESYGVTGDGGLCILLELLLVRADTLRSTCWRSLVACHLAVIL